MALKLIFMGTPEFAVPILKKIYKSEHKVLSVFTQPPKKSKQGQKVNECSNCEHQHNVDLIDDPATGFAIETPYVFQCNPEQRNEAQKDRGGRGQCSPGAGNGRTEFAKCPLSVAAYLD